MYIHTYIHIVHGYVHRYMGWLVNEKGWLRDNHYLSVFEMTIHTRKLDFQKSMKWSNVIGKFFWYCFFACFVSSFFLMSNFGSAGEGSCHISLLFLKHLFFLKYTQWQCILSFWQQHCNVKGPKNLTPWWDLNLGYSNLDADAMTTMPHFQS
jgi:hypothetical protein